MVSWAMPQAGMAWGRWPARIRPHHARFGLFSHLPRQRRTAIPARARPNMALMGRRWSLACSGLTWVSPLGFKSYANLPGMERQSDGDMSSHGRNHVVVRSEGAGFPKVGVRG